MNYWMATLWVSFFSNAESNAPPFIRYSNWGKIESAFGNLSLSALLLPLSVHAPVFVTLRLLLGFFFFSCPFLELQGPYLKERKKRTCCYSSSSSSFSSFSSSFLRLVWCSHKATRKKVVISDEWTHGQTADIHRLTDWRLHTRRRRCTTSNSRWRSHRSWTRSTRVAVATLL